MKQLEADDQHCFADQKVTCILPYLERKQSAIGKHSTYMRRTNFSCERQKQFSYKCLHVGYPLRRLVYGQSWEFGIFFYDGYQWSIYPTSQNCMVALCKGWGFKNNVNFFKTLNPQRVPSRRFELWEGSSIKFYCDKNCSIRFCFRQQIGPFYSRTRLHVSVKSHLTSHFFVCDLCFIGDVRLMSTVNAVIFLSAIFKTSASFDVCDVDMNRPLVHVHVPVFCAQCSND